MMPARLVMLVVSVVLSMLLIARGDMAIGSIILVVTVLRFAAFQRIYGRRAQARATNNVATDRIAKPRT